MADARSRKRRPPGILGEADILQDRLRRGEISTLIVDLLAQMNYKPARLLVQPALIDWEAAEMLRHDLLREALLAACRFTRIHWNLHLGTPLMVVWWEEQGGKVIYSFSEDDLSLHTTIS
jgi:hypothetical protein